MVSFVLKYCCPCLLELCSYAHKTLKFHHWFKCSDGQTPTEKDTAVESKNLAIFTHPEPNKKLLFVITLMN